MQALPAESPDAVRAAFVAVGSVATADIVALYGPIGGMRLMDEHHWRLWPLEELKDQPASAHGPVFADVLMCASTYRLSPVSAGLSAVHIDRRDAAGPRLIAPSLPVILQRLAADPDDLLESR